MIAPELFASAGSSAAHGDRLGERVFPRPSPGPFDGDSLTSTSAADGTLSRATPTLFAKHPSIVGHYLSALRGVDCSNTRARVVGPVWGCQLVGHSKVQYPRTYHHGRKRKRKADHDQRIDVFPPAAFQPDRPNRPTWTGKQDAVTATSVTLSMAIQSLEKGKSAGAAGAPPRALQAHQEPGARRRS